MVESQSLSIKGILVIRENKAHRKVNNMRGKQRERIEGRKKCKALKNFLFYCVLFNFFIQSSLPISFNGRKEKFEM